MTRKRRSFSAADKAAAVRKHLVDKVPVSQIADQMQVQPTLIHNWVNAVMSQAERAFETPRST
ncbi:transposase, partial [Rhodopirellula bahusiensis]